MSDVVGQGRIIDGKAIAGALRHRIAGAVAGLKDRHGVVPGLAVVLVGDDPASQVYVRNKARACEEAGINSRTLRMSDETPQHALLELIETLNADASVHGILVQLPLPPQITERAVIETVAPYKDVDGFHVMNAGLLAIGGDAMVPCTPLGCIIMLQEALGDLSGRDAVVIGRSNIVGKPMAQLLLRENCTVTMAHSRTRDLPAVCRRADILVAAIGRAETVRGDWIKPGATVIDVGINRVEQEGRKPRLVGDVAFDEAVKVAGAITPVPGGVGPMTIACLLANTLTACCRQNGISPPSLAG